MKCSLESKSKRNFPAADPRKFKFFDAKLIKKTPGTEQKPPSA